MLIEKDVQKILNQLAKARDPVKIAFDGSDIFIRFIDDASKLHLTTSVYYGGNYIPSSVRHCLSHKTPFFQKFSIRTYLSIDEPHFQVYLHYLGQNHDLTPSGLRNLLEEFGLVAEKWRLYLDEHDKNDLVHVRTF
jgi:hypothetical protein